MEKVTDEEIRKAILECYNNFVKAHEELDFKAKATLAKYKIKELSDKIRLYFDTENTNEN